MRVEALRLLARVRRRLALIRAPVNGHYLDQVMIILHMKAAEVTMSGWYRLLRQPGTVVMASQILVRCVKRGNELVSSISCLQIRR